MLLIIHQTIVFVLMLTGSMACGILPVYLIFRWNRIQRKISLWTDSLGNAHESEFRTLTLQPNCQEILRSKFINVARSFAFGVLFGACFIHLMPENHALFELALDQGHNQSQTIDTSGHHKHDIPWNEMIICCGFLLIYVFDVIMHQLVESFFPKHDHCMTGSDGQLHLESIKLFKLNRRKRVATDNQAEVDPKTNQQSDDCNDHVDQIEQVPCKETVNQTNQLNSVMKMHACTGTIMANPVLPAHQCDVDGKRIKPNKLITSAHNGKQTNAMNRNAIHNYGSVGNPSNDGDPLSTGNQPGVDTPDHAPYAHQKRFLSLFNCLLVVGALSMHAVFEGFAIGMQQEPLLLYQLAGAICVHKLLISFVLGLNLMCETSRLQDTFWGILVFSLMTPLGIFGGAIWLNMYQTHYHSYSVPVANALATGTMIYVTFFELRPQMVHHTNRQSFYHFLAALVGFLAVLLTLMINFD